MTGAQKATLAALAILVVCVFGVLVILVAGMLMSTNSPSVNLPTVVALTGTVGATPSFGIPLAGTPTAFSSTVQRATPPGGAFSPFQLQVVSITETHKLVEGPRTVTPVPGYKYVFVGIAIENTSTEFQDSKMAWRANLTTSEGFNYNQVSGDSALFTNLPPGFRILKNFVFEVGENTHPSRFSFQDLQGSYSDSRWVDIVTAQITGSVQMPTFPVANPSLVKIEKIGMPHVLQPYVPEFLGGAPYPKTPVRPTPRIVTVVSAKYSASQVKSVKDLSIVIELKHDNPGENALFTLNADIIGDDGLQGSLVMVGREYWCGSGVCANLGPNQRKQVEISTQVDAKTNRHYLILRDYFPGPIVRDRWIVDLTQ